jgi:hypothetical protein
MKKMTLILWSLLLVPEFALADWRIGPGSEIFSDVDSAFAVSERGVDVLGVMCRDGAPFLWAQGWPAKGGSERRENFRVIVDGRPFTVTGDHTPPDGLWTGAPPPALIAALRGGSGAVVAPPGQPEARFSLRGSSRALTTVLSRCGDAADAAPTAGATASAVDALIASRCGG